MWCKKLCVVSTVILNNPNNTMYVFRISNLIFVNLFERQCICYLLSPNLFPICFPFIILTFILIMFMKFNFVDFRFQFNFVDLILIEFRLCKNKLHVSLHCKTSNRRILENHKILTVSCTFILSTITVIKIYRSTTGYDISKNL